jgi:hypothetical protein
VQLPCAGAICLPADETREISFIRNKRRLTGIGVKPSARVGVRNSLHQFADFRFQKLVRDDQRLDRIACVAAACRDGLVGCGLKPIWLAR